MFGSAARDDFRKESDVDLLCTLRPDVQCGLFGWVALKFDLESMIIVDGIQREKRFMKETLSK